MGGLYFGPDRLRDLSGELGLARADLPRGAGFAGCIRSVGYRSYRNNNNNNKN